MVQLYISAFLKLLNDSKIKVIICGFLQLHVKNDVTRGRKVVGGQGSGARQEPRWLLWILTEAKGGGS